MRRPRSIQTALLPYKCLHVHLQLGRTCYFRLHDQLHQSCLWIARRKAVEQNVESSTTKDGSTALLLYRFLAVATLPSSIANYHRLAYSFDGFVNLCSGGVAAVQCLVGIHCIQ